MKYMYKGHSLRSIKVELQEHTHTHTRKYPSVITLVMLYMDFLFKQLYNFWQLQHQYNPTQTQKLPLQQYN